MRSVKELNTCPLVTKRLENLRSAKYTIKPFWKLKELYKVQYLISMEVSQMYSLCRPKFQKFKIQKFTFPMHQNNKRLHS